MNTRDCCLRAVYEGDILTLKKILKGTFDYNTVIDLHLNAICSGRVDILQYLIKNGFPLYQHYTDYCKHAAIYGHIEVLKLLRLLGAEWDYWTIVWAANKGHVHIIKWAIANGCDYDKDITLSYVTLAQRWDILENIDSYTQRKPVKVVIRTMNK